MRPFAMFCSVLLPESYLSPSSLSDGFHNRSNRRKFPLGWPVSNRAGTLQSCVRLRSFCLRDSPRIRDLLLRRCLRIRSAPQAADRYGQSLPAPSFARFSCNHIPFYLKTSGMKRGVWQKVMKDSVSDHTKGKEHASCLGG